MGLVREPLPEEQLTQADRNEQLLGMKLARSAFMAENPLRREKHWIRELERRTQQEQRELQGATERIWEGLYSQHGSEELRREYLAFSVRLGIRPIHQLSAEQKLELLIQDMTETLAFTSHDKRAKLLAEWEWDLEERCWRWDWQSWELQSKRRRARALGRIDSEFDRLTELSTELYLADGEALADFEAARAERAGGAGGGGGGGGWGDNSAVVAAGNVAAT